MRILFATGNQNKITEARQVLEPLGHSVEGLVIDGQRPDFDEPKDLGLAAVAEAKITQALSFIQDTEYEGSAILVEDSGIFLDAFPEWPGAESADVEHQIGLAGIIERVNQAGDRGAEYRAVAILSDGDQHWQSDGVCRGTIATQIRGSHGFGYDPIFIPEMPGEYSEDSHDESDHDPPNSRTFGELGAEVKNQISHRTRAMKGLSSLLGGPSR